MVKFKVILTSNSSNINKFKNWKYLGCFFGIIGCIQFIIITIIAMLFYPGGYSFWNNFFSHLGFTKSANNGQPNTISSLLFIITMILGGIFFIPFWLSIRTIFTETKRLRYTTWFGTILGLISCPLLAMVALIPGDIMRDQHLLVTMLFFFFFALGIIVYSIAMLFNKNYDNFYAYIGFAMAVLLLLYMSIFLLNAAVQKITVYVLFSWIIIQGIKVWKILD